MALQIATATTLRDASVDLVRTFARYHQAIGFDHVFLFFDDPDDPAYADIAGLPNVTALRTGPALVAEQRATTVYDRYRPHITSEVMARQNINVGVALARALAMGITWLLHLDIDELLHVPGHDARALFTGQADTTDQVVFFNHEAVPETEPIGDYFREVSLFKTNPNMIDAGDGWRGTFWHRRGWYFNGYKIGKAAVRVASMPVDDGPHRFLARAGAPPLRSSFDEQDACILHFQTCGLSRFIQKYRRLGRFADKWYGTNDIPEVFHLRSRDIVLDGSDDQRAAFYDRHVLLHDASVSIERELERGRLRRITIPPHVFGG